MKFNNLITILLLVFFTNQLFSQQLTVKNFELRESDLRAKTNPRNDNNGVPCALLCVQIAAPNCTFEGDYIVGDIRPGFGEYLVYMAKGARKIRIAHPDYLFLPLEFDFPSPLQSMRAYSLILEVPIYTHYAEIVEQQAKNQSTTEKSATQQKKRYKVGDHYNENGKEGVVFWVDETGKHGKIVSIKEPSSRLPWSSDKYEKKRLIGANSETDGAKNMEVVKQIPDWESKYPAFKWCADLGEGWYLPAKNELEQIKQAKTEVNRTLEQHGKLRQDWHLSSTELDGKWVWIVRMYGRIIGGTKGYGYYVRAVSTF